MLNHLVRQDVLTGKRRLAPLGCVVLFIGALFVGACILGWYALLTPNVARLAEPPTLVAALDAPAPPTTIPPTLTASPTFVATATASPSPAPLTGSARVTATMTAAAKAKATPTKTVASAAKPSAAVAATQGITWTVRPLDVSGLMVYDGPPEIKAWIVRDFMAALKFEHDNLLKKDVILANLAQYYSGPMLADYQRGFANAFQDGSTVRGSYYALARVAPYERPYVTQFTADGRRAMLNDHTAAGERKHYDTRTGKQIAAAPVPSMVTTYWMEYSVQDKRWKVSDCPVQINADTYEVIFRGRQ